MNWSVYFLPDDAEDGSPTTVVSDLTFEEAVRRAQELNHLSPAPGLFFENPSIFETRLPQMPEVVVEYVCPGVLRFTPTPIINLFFGVSDDKSLWFRIIKEQDDWVLRVYTNYNHVLVDTYRDNETLQDAMWFAARYTLNQGI